MANINSHWKRGMAVGCVHSVYACPEAQKAVLRFRDLWKPHTVVDLGDVHDFTAFRSGAKGTPDEMADLGKDFQAGVDWLKRYRPTHRTEGNHDVRMRELCSDPRAIVSHCATIVAENLRQIDEANGTLVRPYCQDEGWWRFGDTDFGHGWAFNENALRDHAETYGKCVIAHLHRPGEMPGRHKTRPTAWCVGTLADPKKLHYAVRRRNWLTWAHGLVQFEYNHRECHVWLTRQKCNHGSKEEWRFPL